MNTDARNMAGELRWPEHPLETDWPLNWGEVRFFRPPLITIYMELMPMRNRAERRHNDWREARRKRRIIRAYGWDYYDNLHQYSKNKIHCSCPMCSAKTNNKRRKVWGVGRRNWCMMDRRRIEEMEDQILDNE